MSEDDARREMVRRQVAARGVRDPRVLEAMQRVPRHLFVPEPLQDNAYEDRPQPIGLRQTISQPLIVGQMTELLALSGAERVLEVGTGSGYHTALLAELAREVVSVERHGCLAERARCLLEWLGYENVEIQLSDGTLGFLPRAPYDRILVTAAAPHVPEPLLDQLLPGGRLVIPVGPPDRQTLLAVTREAAGGCTTESHGECMFVPLVGEHGWDEPPTEAG